MTVLRDALSRSDSFLSRRGDLISKLERTTTPDNNDPPFEHLPALHKARKPSPGLAARLKALSFASSKDRSSSPSSVHDHIGRIPEDHIRSFDFNHQANSANASLIERRGRAWSGASAGFLRPEVSVRSFSDFGVVENPDRTHSVGSSFEDTVMAALAEPLGMDSQKYRLPEHTNGNGTKAMPDTRRAHLDRILPGDDCDDLPPPPIPKDTPPQTPRTGESSNDSPSYFNPFGLPRAGSIYTLSRASFASQLAQLTSLQLPDAESLSTKVAAIKTSRDASRALMGAAEQIRKWIFKASDVVSGLDGEDDVEWAAAGGREGLAEVDNAITRFEELINVYVTAIEALQSRDDIGTVSTDELQRVVMQVEDILNEWDKIKKTLRAVKISVEMAMEWEELWNTVLGDIGNEMDILSRLVFEMEEKRHKNLMAEPAHDGVDIGELETIVEETPPAATRSRASNRFTLQPSLLGPATPTTPAMAQDDSSLLALFARMQPLRASLDFLPMRLSTFHARAEDMFPTACEELEEKRGHLEASWKNLEKDAESLRRELGEDRWVLVFRGAGRQAQKMYESVERSVVKLREAVDSGAHLNNPAAMGKKIESYEAKKLHYGPAIERVLSIIDKGVKDRLTVNGEILRLHSDMQRKWESLKEMMVELDHNLDEIQADRRNQQLRDSISSMVSNDRSTIGSLDTPGSSPASSVVMSGYDSLTPSKNGKVRFAASNPPQSGGRRNASMPPSTSQLPRKAATPRFTSYGGTAGRASPSPRQGSATPTGNRLTRSITDTRPRWNSSVNTTGTVIGHNFKPLSLTTPSPHRKTSSPIGSDSRIPFRSPLTRESSSSPMPGTTPTPARTSASRLAIRDRQSSASPGPYSQQVLRKSALSPGPYSQQALRKSAPSPGPYSQQVLRKSSASPGPYSQQVLAATTPRPRLASKSSMSALTNRRSSFQPTSSDPACSPDRSRPPLTKRPASSLAAPRRISLLPTPRGRQSFGTTAEGSPQTFATASATLRRNSSVNSATSKDSKGREKPRWR
ncbi:hypothetical protein BP5796_07365 [Coleophoma crateriformis]|uniref:Karyogamy protein n=1 Tax=Coleophoma crateriformis TaxID=565419 RepID=A0A3D8RIQ1_9HELO|nr:hypothetical protein BP5796_07365 [Coleophoma crateriformis]